MRIRHHSFFAAIAAAVALAALPAVAQTALSGHPTHREARFVRHVAGDLRRRFPTADAAVKAGYLRYTDEDNTGAISYANQQWSSDPSHPSQLWYDVNGRLLGADYSVLRRDSPAPPQVWGIDPRRWITLGAHVHYGLAGPSGSILYGDIGAKRLAAAGGSPTHPTPADLVRAHVTTSAASVRFVFPFPGVWDLILWVLPNPDGAFADKNPSVKPAHPVSAM